MYIKFTFFIVFFVLVGCVQERRVEWEKENAEIHGVNFKFLEPMCLLKISSNNPITSLNIDIALGKIIDLAALEQEKPNLNPCANLDSNTFTTVSSFYSRHSWWLLGADDVKFFIVEDINKIRYLVPLWALTKTTNENLNSLSQ